MHCDRFDHTIYVKTYEQWMHPKDVSDTVCQLAAAGKLQTLQLVNRGLPAFPDTLRRCSGLKYISLVYTDTLSIPDWTRELTKIEYFHMEGKIGNSSLQELPVDLFSDMKELALIHLGQHAFPRLPSLDGLTRLQVLTLGVLPELAELPSFASLANLKRLTLAYVPRLDTLPDLTPVKNLEGMASFDRGAFCYNGFLAGQCNLTLPMCGHHPMFNTPPATCLPPERQATPGTLTYFHKFSYSLCAGGAQKGSLLPSEISMQPCNGSMYRYCSVPGLESLGSGICYNMRWMAIDCALINPGAIAMRRLQIAGGLGLPCDPAYEAWLGCPANYR